MRIAVLFWIFWLFLMPCQPASAQWLHHAEEDPFKGDLQMALTSAGGYGFGFRCTEAADLMMVYITPEEADEDTARGLELMPLNLLVIVDKDERISFEASVMTGKGDKLMLVSKSDGLKDLMERVAKAGQRVAVAGEILGTVMHSKVFGVKGTRRAIEPLAKNCGISGFP